MSLKAKYYAEDFFNSYVPKTYPSRFESSSSINYLKQNKKVNPNKCDFKQDTFDSKKTKVRQILHSLLTPTSFQQNSRDIPRFDYMKSIVYVKSATNQDDYYDDYYEENDDPIYDNLEAASDLLSKNKRKYFEDLRKKIQKLSRSKDMKSSAKCNKVEVPSYPEKLPYKARPCSKSLKETHKRTREKVTWKP